MFKPVFVNPLEHHNWSRIGFDPADKMRFEQAEPDFEVTLRAGQVLFIPRGWVHAGQSTESEHSLHITLGVQLLTVHWALKRLLELGEESEALRAALPPDLGGRDFLDLSARLRAVLVEWVAEQPTEVPALRLRAAQRLSVLNQEPK